MIGKNPERVFDGLGIAPGIGIGAAHVYGAGALAVPEYGIDETRVEAEEARLKAAVEAAGKQLSDLRRRARQMPGAAAEEIGFLLDAHAMMLDDSRLLRGAFKRIRDNRINAEAAVDAEVGDIAESFRAMDDAYLAARLDDIRDVAQRLIRNLVNAPNGALSSAPAGSVILAEELSPADTALLDPDRVVGFATVLGGAEGHTAIMARALGIPAVIAPPGFLQEVSEGASVIVDGDTGKIITDPGPATRARYERRLADKAREFARLARLRDQPAITRDRVEIALMANVELPQQLPQMRANGAAGIGLLRSEFMFMNRDDVPGEDEQFAMLKLFVEAAGGRPVTVRTLDIGGEKTVLSVTGDLGDSAHSALGLRGIRLSLRETGFFATQLRAILRVSALGPVRILLPMVSAVSEVRRARALIDTAIEELAGRGLAPGGAPPIGVMIEVPAAALTADDLAAVSDFFAVGSNDLTMYTLAVDRTDEQVAPLYNPLHPAVLRLIREAADAAGRARIPLSICGEMAGDPRFTALLLGLGFRDLSMTASAIPKIKQRVLDLDMAAARRRAELVMSQSDSGRIAMLLDDLNALA